MSDWVAIGAAVTLAVMTAGMAAERPEVPGVARILDAVRLDGRPSACAAGASSRGTVLALALRAHRMGEPGAAEAMARCALHDDPAALAALQADRFALAAWFEARAVERPPRFGVGTLMLPPEP